MFNGVIKTKPKNTGGTLRVKRQKEVNTKKAVNKGENKTADARKINANTHYETCRERLRIKYCSYGGIIPVRYFKFDTNIHVKYKIS